MKPNFTLEEVHQLIFKNWSLKGKVSIIGGYEDQNFKFIATNNKIFNLKISSSDADYLFLKAQNSLINGLSNSLTYQFPEPELDINHNKILIQKVNDKIYFFRLLIWVDGKTFDETKTHSNELFQQLGKFAGSIDNYLIQNDNKIFKRNILWDIRNYQELVPYISYIKDIHVKNIIIYFYEEYSTSLLKLNNKLRSSLIHNDLNNYNIIVNNQGDSIAGLIDFGDMVYSHLINELAITIAYAIIKSDKVDETAYIITKAYNDELKLKKEELEILYYIVGIRLSMSVLFSAFYRKKTYTNEALFVSEMNSLLSLKKWSSLNSSNTVTSLINIAEHQ